MLKIRNVAILLSIFLFNSCEQTHVDFILTPDMLAYVPYRGDETLTFVSNNSDTIIFKGTGIPSTKEIKVEDKSNVAFGHNGYQIFQTKEWDFKGLNNNSLKLVLENTNYGLKNNDLDIHFYGTLNFGFLIDFILNPPTQPYTEFTFNKIKYNNVYCLTYPEDSGLKPDTLIYSKTLGFLSYSTKEGIYWTLIP